MNTTNFDDINYPSHFEMSLNPSQLQEVSLGSQLENITDGGASSSPNLLMNPERHSPSRRRTMKEYDQQITELKNENFNLKLRIYFLDERLRLQFNDSSSDVMKVNVGLKVEIENLKKELREKQDLLLKASSALGVMETTSKAEKDELQRALGDKVRELENQLNQQGCRRCGPGEKLGELNRSDELNEPLLPRQPSVSNETFDLTDWKANVEQLKSSVDSLKSELQESQARIQELRESLSTKERRIQDEELLGIKRNKVIEGLMNAVHMKEKQINALQSDLESRSSELKHTKEQLNEVVKNGTTTLLPRNHSGVSTAGGGDGSVPEVEQHDKLIEDLRRENEKLECAWKDAVKQRDETIQDIQDMIQLERQKSNEKIDSLEKRVKNLRTECDKKNDLVDKLHLAVNERNLLLKECQTLLQNFDDSNQSERDTLKVKIEEKLSKDKEFLKEITKSMNTFRYTSDSGQENSNNLVNQEVIIQHLTKEVEAREGKIHNLMGVIEELKTQISNFMQLVSSKEAMIVRLQKSLCDCDKKLQDVSVNNSARQTDVSVFEQSITDKDHLIEELITEKTRNLLENEKTAENFAIALNDKSSALKQLKDKLDEEETNWGEKMERLQAELKKKTTDLQNLEEQYRQLQDTYESTSSQLQNAVKTKDTFNNVEKLTEEVKTLHDKLNAKEAFINHLKEYLEKILRETDGTGNAAKSSIGSSASFSKFQEVNDISQLDNALCDLENRLKTSWGQNKKMEHQLISLKKKITEIRRTAESCHESRKLHSIDVEPSNIDIENDLLRLHNEVRILTSLNKRLHQQVNVEHANSSPLSSRPTIRRCLSGQQLNVVTSSTCQHEGSSDCNPLLLDARNEIKKLKTKLSSTEVTVHRLANKLNKYRSLLNQAGVPLSPTDTYVSQAVSLCSEHSISNENGRPRVTKERSVSAEEVRFVSAAGVVNPDCSALSADDIMTASKEDSKLSQAKNGATAKSTSSFNPVKSTRCVNFGDDVITTPERSFFPLKPDMSDSVRVSGNLLLTGNISTPDSLAEYGQSNDILELKEQICWLKLRVEERESQLQGLAKEKEVIERTINSTYPSLNQTSLLLQEQTLSPADCSALHRTSLHAWSPNKKLSSTFKAPVLVNAECQVGDGLIIKSAASRTFESVDDEIQWLYKQNSVLQEKLDLLPAEMPPEKSSSPYHLLQNELVLLRQRLCDSHDCCETLRNRLEELAEFLEQLLQFDENGLLDTSRITAEHVAKIRLHIVQSRELSQNLSQSLLVGDFDVSALSSCMEKSPNTTLTSISVMEKNTESEGEVPNVKHSDYHSVGDEVENMGKLPTVKILKQELEARNGVIVKLRSQVHLLQEQIRQRDIENSWSYVEEEVPRFEKRCVPHHQRHSVASGDTVERARSGSRSYLQASAKYEGAEIVENLSANRTLVSDTGKLIDRNSICGLEHPTVSPDQNKTPEPSNRLEKLWLRCKDSSNEDGIATKPSQSSYDDLILLLNTEHMGPLQTAEEIFTSEPCLNDLDGDSVHAARKQEESNSEIRTLEALQEQAIMDEYVRHYTSRQFTDCNGHSTFREPGGLLASNNVPPEKERTPKSRHRLGASPSDSESWSEPDRDVSQQRMGIEPEDKLFSSQGDRSVGRSPKSIKCHGSGTSDSTPNTDGVVRLGKEILSPASRKSRDSWNVRRLISRLQNLEELNNSLKSELKIFHSLSASIAQTPGKQAVSPNAKNQKKSNSSPASRSLSFGERRKSLESPMEDRTRIMLQENLAEIRALRLRLEDSIQINDHLREKLERRLSMKQLNSNGQFKQNVEEMDRLCFQLEQKEQMVMELQKQAEFYAKTASDQENECRHLKFEVNDLSAKLEAVEEEIQHLKRELSDKDDATQQIKHSNQRIQGTLVNLQTALTDKDRVNKELREANARMQRALDAVNKLIQQRETELRSSQDQCEQLNSDMRNVHKKYVSEIAQLTSLVKEKGKEVHEKEKLWKETATEEVRELRNKCQAETSILRKSLDEKSKKLSEALRSYDDLQSQFKRKEEEAKNLQKKVDDSSVSIMELEKQLEKEHGQCLSLQQKLNTHNKLVFEKDNSIFSLQEKLHQQSAELEKLEKEKCEDSNKIDDLRQSLETVKRDLAERERRADIQRVSMEKMQQAISEKKRALEKQLERARSLENKIELLSATASVKEQKCLEDHTYVSQLQEKLQQLEKQCVESRQDMREAMDSKENVESRLREQEKLYMGLQNKLDERGTNIRKLEEELNQSWEDNEKLQHQVLSLQNRLQETVELNKSMKSELNVYEHLHANISSRNSGSGSIRKSSGSKRGSLDLNTLLQEIKNLRSQLELSIKTNIALRTQLEDQLSSRSIEIPPLIRANQTTDNDVSTLTVIPAAVSPVDYLVPQKDGGDNKKSRHHSGSLMDSDDPCLPKEKVRTTSHTADSGTYSENDCHHNGLYVRQHSKSSDYVSEDAVADDNHEPLNRETQADRGEKKRRISSLKLPLKPFDVFNEESHQLGTGHQEPHSMYSSPDLGIESDPNHFSSLERRMGHITDDQLWAIRAAHSSSQSEPEKLESMSYNIRDTDSKRDTGSNRSRVDSDNRLLYAIGRLDDYELLKKEIEESVVVLKGLQARVKERIKSSPKSSPTKSMEQVTLKELNNSASNLQVCLEKSLDVINCFWTAMLPSGCGASAEENQKLTEEIRALKKKLHIQKKTLNAALQKLAATNRLKAGMENAITKQLSKTHEVLKRARGNLEDNAVTQKVVDGC